jgi:hypothetical protein
LSGLGIVRKNRRIAKIVFLKKITVCTVNSLILQRSVSVLSLRALATSSRGLKKDYSWSDGLEKTPPNPQIVQINPFGYVIGCG